MSTYTIEHTTTDMNTAVNSERGLSTQQRDELLVQFKRDGYAVMPFSLDDTMFNDCLSAVTELGEDAPDQSRKIGNCVDANPAFRRLMTWKPALQMAHDLFGPSFQLNQSNATYRPKDDGPVDTINSISWHADGPRPEFPNIEGVMALYYLKFGYFLSDLSHETGGSLQVVRGSHLRPELDGRGSEFNIDDYKDDLVSFHVPANSVVMFHQALWHAAPTNQSDQVRLNAYYSYSPTWMRPFDRGGVTKEEALNLSPTEAYLLGAPRQHQEFWMPSQANRQVLKDYARD